jgi:carbon-monoxide dehydrogenase large subunit
MSKLVGERMIRLEDDRLVRGNGMFVADETMPDLCYAAILRSPAACGRIRSIDTTAAAACEDVLAVLTGPDVIADGLGGIPWEVCPPGLENKSRFPGDPDVAESQPLLASSRVRYVGEPVALVIATSQAAALAGMDATVLDIELDEPVIGVETFRHEDGDAEALFTAEIGNRARADECLEHAFGVVRLRTHIPRLAAAPIEPRGYLSRYDPKDETWTIVAAVGKPHPVRDTIAKHVLHVEPGKIRLIAGDIGGGFGGKNVAHAEAALTLWAAKRVGRPVSWISTRLDAFLSDMQGRDHLIDASLAFAKDGLFTAVSYDSMVDLGAYLSPRGVMPSLTSLKTITGPYRIEAAHGRVRGFLTNTVPTCTYRGAGAPECAFAIERLVDMAALKLSIDPAELRRRNLLAPAALPWTAPTGVTFHSVDFPAVFKAALGNKPKKRKSVKSTRFRYGTGIAYAIECYGASFDEAAEIVVRKQAPVEIRIGTKSSGQSHETTYAQIAADALALSCDHFRIVQGDTLVVARGNGTGASRSMTVGGSAIIQAAQKLLSEAGVMAAEAMQCTPESLDYAAGRFRQKGPLAGSLDLFSLAEFQPDGCLRAQAVFKPSIFTIPGGCHVADVEVDMETGQVRLLRYRAVHDAGVAVNPMVVEGQLHGGIAQGIGAALGEALRFDSTSGQLITASFQDYAMPHADGVCAFDITLIGVPCASNLIGAKPVGEAGTVAAPPAIINAIIDAIDDPALQHIELPATPERVWSAIQACQKNRPV